MGVARGADRCALRAVAHRGLRRFLPGLQPAHQVGEHDQLSGARAPALQGRGRRHPGALLSAAASAALAGVSGRTQKGGQDPRPFPGLCARSSGAPRAPGPGHCGTPGGGAARDCHTRLRPVCASALGGRGGREEDEVLNRFLKNKRGAIWERL